MPTNTHRNPGNHDDWSFNWLPQATNAVNIQH